MPDHKLLSLIISPVLFPLLIGSLHPEYPTLAQRSHVVKCFQRKYGCQKPHVFKLFLRMLQITWIRNSTLGVAFATWEKRKPQFWATPGVIPKIDGNPHERLSFASAFSELYFENWGGHRASEKFPGRGNCKLTQEQGIRLRASCWSFPTSAYLLTYFCRFLKVKRGQNPAQGSRSFGALY